MTENHGFSGGSRAPDLFDILMSYMEDAIPMSVVLCTAGTLFALLTGSLEVSPLPGAGIVLGTVLPLGERILLPRSAEGIATGESVSDSLISRLIRRQGRRTASF